MLEKTRSSHKTTHITRTHSLIHQSNILLVTFRVKNIVSFCVKKLFHFSLKSCYICREKLLHFALMLHFASIVTFCGVKASPGRSSQKPWPTLTRKTPGKTQHSPAVTPGKYAVHFTEHLVNAIQQCVLQLILTSFSATCKQAVDRRVLIWILTFPAKNSLGFILIILPASTLLAESLRSFLPLPDLSRKIEGDSAG